MAAGFTAAELEVLPLIALQIKVAAHRLGRHESSIKQHTKAIASKLGAADRQGAIVIATRAGIQLEIVGGGAKEDRRRT